MKKIEKTTAAAPATKTRRSLLRDTRGAELVQALILLGLVALAGMTAFGALGTSISTKATEGQGAVDGITMGQ